MTKETSKTLRERIIEMGRGFFTESDGLAEEILSLVRKETLDEVENKLPPIEINDYKSGEMRAFTDGSNQAAQKSRDVIESLRAKKDV